MIEINYDEITSQLKFELNTDCAIANRYGIVLSSLIKEFAKGKVIPHKILELILDRQEIADDLNLNRINSFALEAQEYNYLFSFSEELILISKLPLDLNLSKFMPSISVFLEKLSKESKEQKIKEFSIFDFSTEIGKIEEALAQESNAKEKFEIIKDLIKYISR